MPISVRCPNGHKLKVKESHAGRTLRCPACRAAVVAPLPEPTRKSSIPKSYLILGGVVGGSAVAMLIGLVAWAVVGGSDGATTVESGKSDATQPAGGTAEPSIPQLPPSPTGDIKEIASKLRRIGLAFHNFHDVHHVFAPGQADHAAVAAEGTAATRQATRGLSLTRLSWRVHLLPFLDQQPLYDQFHLDEPWDSPHNTTLLDRMPEIYRIGSADEQATRFQVITGPDMLFGHANGPRISEIRDGASHTILTLVTGSDQAVPWTRPDDLTLDPADPLRALGTIPDGLVHCVMADGDSLSLRNSIEPTEFLALATPHGKEIVDAGTYRRQFEEGRPYASVNRTGQNAAVTPAKDVSSASQPLATAQVSKTDIHTTLHRIAMAFLMHNDHFGLYAPPDSNDEFGSRLSWRVHLLPFLGEQALYQRFRLNEPWDSPHNKTLLSEIPAIYRFDATPRTRICVVTGPQMLFGNGRPMSPRDIPDGVANTLLAVAVGADAAVPWTDPADPAFSPQKIIDLIRSVNGGPIDCVTADGAPLTLPSDVAPETLTALITPAGGEVIDAAALRKEHGPQYEADPALKSQIQLTMKTKPGRMQKLKDIVLALHNYHDTYQQFPPAKDSRSVDATGKPFLSWRVHTLPYLDQQTLFDQFKLDEPWDSPHNQTLLDKMPDVFRDPQDAIVGTKTRFVTFTGPDTPFSAPHGPRLREFSDGTSQTLLVLIAGQDKAVPWTKPEDIPFDANSPVGCLGELNEPGIFFGRADGAVQIVKSSIPPDWFKAIVTPAGGELLPERLSIFGIR